ncbi:uncharacterized protein [Miscanthus floridulus]|uniref:uncharacterized protein n=1 Tax=Miscanthus floridulus TaxID=154761 RepID=UPI00345A3DAA
MDSGTGSSADQIRDASLPVCARNRSKASRSLAAVAQTRCSTKCVPGSEAPRLDEAQHPQHRPWADLPPDILGVVAGRLVLLEDRARLRSVCRAWRAAARIHRRLPPCPPLLVLSDFSFFSFRSEGTMMGACRRVPLPERETAGSGNIRCVGSFEGWLVGVKRNKSRYFGDLRCFLMNAFSQVVIRLPPPSGRSGAARSVDTFSTSLPIINGSGVVNCAFNTAPCVMSFTKVILSSPPDSVSKCVVAALSDIKSAAKLALWRSGMKSWCVCDGAWRAHFIDIVFCQGKLFLLSCSEVAADLLVFEIADDNSGLMVSHVECCAIEMPEVSDSLFNIWCILEWRGKLLIVEICHGNDEFGESFVEVRVFEADLSANPVRLTEIESLDGDCIFVSPCSSESFRSCHYGEGGGEGDLIYIFLWGHLHRFVYNMKDGTMAPFAADIPEDKLGEADGRVMNSTLLFPPE